MSWLTPQHVDDATRILKGAAIVLARAAKDSSLLQRLAATDYHQGVTAVMDLLKAHQERSHGEHGWSDHGQTSSSSTPGSVAVPWHDPSRSITVSHEASQVTPEQRLAQYIYGTTFSMLNSDLSETAVPSPGPYSRYLFPQTTEMYGIAGAQFNDSTAPEVGHQMGRIQPYTPVLSFEPPSVQAVLNDLQKLIHHPEIVLRTAQQTLADPSRIIDQLQRYGAQSAMVPPLLLQQAQEALQQLRSVLEPGARGSTSATQGWDAAARSPADSQSTLRSTPTTLGHVTTESLGDGMVKLVNGPGQTRSDTVNEVYGKVAQGPEGLGSSIKMEVDHASRAVMESASSDTSLEQHPPPELTGPQKGVATIHGTSHQWGLGKGADVELPSPSSSQTSMPTDMVDGSWSRASFEQLGPSPNSHLHSESPGEGTGSDHIHDLRAQVYGEVREKDQGGPTGGENLEGGSSTRQLSGLELPTSTFSGSVETPDLLASTPSETECQGPLAAEGPTSIRGSGVQVTETTSTVTNGTMASAEGEATPEAPDARRVFRERRVPSSPIGRALGFAGMGASLLFGSFVDGVRNTLGPSQPPPEVQGQNLSSTFLTEQNAERLANALCRMRGAALKIGQMLSIQDETVLPPQVQAALERVRNGADVMPRRQLERVLRDELGNNWQSKFKEFDFEPRAAASIGQVHSAHLPDGRRVALKIQYPGVARSIESDVDNLMRVISVANILPRGMYVESAVKVAKRELAMECDYTYEARCQTRFKQLIADDPDLREVFHVPEVIPWVSSSRVLTSEWVHGVSIDKVKDMPQAVRDAVGTRLLRLTLKELFEWRFMQTDPNWGNFLYDRDTDMLNLIDFGAARDYPKAFVDDYLEMVKACAEKDGDAVVDLSTRLGFLTGDESKVMLNAHTEAGFIVGTPFSREGVYDFGTHSGMTARVSELGSVMLKHRMTPPPEEAYSLHRRLSGAFLACMKLRAQVPCRELFYQTYHAKKFPEQLSVMEG